MSNTEEPETHPELGVAEYEALKVEQVERIKNRDTFVNYVIVAIGVVSAVAVREPVLLLVIPWLSLAFGWTFLMNDLKIAEIGRYLAQTYPQAGWEQWRQSSPSWLTGRKAALAVQFLIFVTPAIVATAFFTRQLGEFGLAGYLGLGLSVACIVLLLLGLRAASRARLAR